VVPFPDYTYEATVVSVHDGDTCTLDLALGFWVTARMSCRLAGFNCIELADPGGREAGEHLAGLIPPGSPVTVRSVKPDKYAGRFDGVIYNLVGTNVNEQMITDGYAAPWAGSGPRPLPPWPIPPAS
jgi:endonuclease YncB( thermonuclease family)